MPEGHRVDLRRMAVSRFGAYASILALLTGIGLLFSGGVRAAESWGWFALATLGAAIGSAWTLRSTLGSVDQRVGAARSEPRLPDEEPSIDPEPAGLDSNTGSQAEADGVDYLMALRHEFRTPLNAVLGFSDVLLSGIDGEVNDSQREDLEIIRASGIRLRLLLDSALDLSQLAGSELRLDAERIDVRELVARAVAEAGQLWANKRTAACTLPEQACISDVDEARLRRSILVLADYLATDHRDARIMLSLTPSNDHLAIEVLAEPSVHLPLDSLPTTAEVLASEDPREIRRWPVAVTSEVIARHDGSLYRGDAPSRFLIRLPMSSVR